MMARALEIIAIAPPQSLDYKSEYESLKHYARSVLSDAGKPIPAVNKE